MPSRRLALVAGLVAVSVVAGACSGDDEGTEAAPQSDPSPTPLTTCPLTGEDPGRRVDLTRPAVAIKVENSPQARPQSGLEDADVVFEEIVEGGITRFLVLFHCHDSKQVGPVRSARFDDPKIAKVFTRAIAFSGANAIARVKTLAILGSSKRALRTGPTCLES